MSFPLFHRFLLSCSALETWKYRFWPILSVKAQLCDDHNSKTVGCMEKTNTTFLIGNFISFIFALKYFDEKMTFLTDF